VWRANNSGCGSAQALDQDVVVANDEVSQFAQPRYVDYMQKGWYALHARRAAIATHLAHDHLSVSFLTIGGYMRSIFSKVSDMIKSFLPQSTPRKKLTSLTDLFEPS